DVQRRLDVVPEDLAQDAALACGLACGRMLVCQRRTIAAAQQVRAGPRPDTQAAHGEHRREYGLHKRLAGLAIASRPWQALELCQLFQGWQSSSGARREIRERAAGAKSCVRVERAGRQYGTAAAQGSYQFVEVVVRRIMVEWRLG